MISDETMEKALNYLAQTDEDFAKLKGNVERLDKQEKTVLGLAFLSSAGTNGEREYKARTSEAYQGWQNEYEDAIVSYETVKNKRLRAELTIEVWRSLNASRRKGNL